MNIYILDFLLYSQDLIIVFSHSQLVQQAEVTLHRVVESLMLMVRQIKFLSGLLNDL